LSPSVRPRLGDGETHRVQTAPVTVEAQQKKGDDVKKGGVGAGVGAIVGGVAVEVRGRRLARSPEARGPCW
jgi:L-aminopeptidase/D-esterase-like protein